MRIALIGYGKMGKAIEEIAISKGHEIVLRITHENINEFSTENIQKAEVCIEFSSPETAFSHVKKCLEAHVPTVCGTTAWLDHLEDAKAICLKNETAFLFASNFSIGVNLFFKINKMVSKLMSNHHEYNVTMEEIHHTQKKDAPSGTAVTLSETIIENYPEKDKWVNEHSDRENELVIISKRIDPAPGTHSIHFDSDIDSITLTHTAHSRKGFAMGALMAAEYIYNKKGVFTMEDILG
jgi:4-hydroxy-tetrahydrodipicolinate reductase